MNGEPPGLCAAAARPLRAWTGSYAGAWRRRRTTVGTLRTTLPTTCAGFAKIAEPPSGRCFRCGPRPPLDVGRRCHPRTACFVAIGMAVGARRQRQAKAPVAGCFKKPRSPTSPGGNVVRACRPTGNGSSTPARQRATGTSTCSNGRKEPRQLDQGLVERREPARLLSRRGVDCIPLGAGSRRPLLMGAAGDSVLRLTDAGHNPAWSPDGSKIAYATEGVPDPFRDGARARCGPWAVISRKWRLISPGDAVQTELVPAPSGIAYWPGYSKGGRAQSRHGARDMAAPRRWSPTTPR